LYVEWGEGWGREKGKERRRKGDTAKYGLTTKMIH
jgi:hypothetical protein